MPDKLRAANGVEREPWRTEVWGSSTGTLKRERPGKHQESMDEW
jgi:hypothetical protein